MIEKLSVTDGDWGGGGGGGEEGWPINNSKQSFATIAKNTFTNRKYCRNNQALWGCFFLRESTTLRLGEWGSRGLIIFLFF